jgi:hypothetical protein
MTSARPARGTLLQGFEWYLPPDAQHWSRLARRAAEFADAGVTAVWIPPVRRGGSVEARCALQFARTSLIRATLTRD